MKEFSCRFPEVKGRFLDKEKFASEHPKLANCLETLPDEINFAYDKEGGKISYYLDAGAGGCEIPEDSCGVLPLIVAQGIQDLEDMLAASREKIKLGPNQKVIHHP